MDSEFFAAEEEWNAIASVTVAANASPTQEYRQG